MNAYGKRELPQPSTGPRSKRHSQSNNVTDDNISCDICQDTFKNAFSLKRHVASKHSPPSTFFCHENGWHESFTRNDTLLRHQRTQHGAAKEPCSSCGARIRHDGMVEHMETKICHRNRPSVLLAKYKTFEAARYCALHEFDIAKWPRNVRTGESTVAASCSPGANPDQVGAKTTSCTSIVKVQNGSSRYSSDSLAAGTGTPHRLPELQSADNPSTDMSANGRYCRSRSEIVESAIACDVPIPVTTALCYQVEPMIVPDSPRAIPVQVTLDQIMLNCDSDINESINHFDDNMEGLRPRNVNMADALTLRPKFGLFNSPRSAQRHYRMKFNSSCALCSTRLSADTETVFQHAKTHFQQRAQPDLKCVHCGVMFAYESDLLLHSSNLELWAFCRGPSDEIDVPGNWLLEAFANDRQSFVDLLRRWESLQLLLYLQAVHRLLRSAHAPPLNFTTSKTEPDPHRSKGKETGSIYTGGAATEPSVCRGRDNPCFDELAATFSRQSLHDPQWTYRDDYPRYRHRKPVVVPDPSRESMTNEPRSDWSIYGSR